MKIAHISDLHFGCASDEIRDALLAHILSEGVDLVIASGDITQSATVAEFEQAHAFFAQLPMPVFAIPGNHDLPGMDFARFFNPFARYKRFINEDLNPERETPLVHIKGINTARMILPHWNWANGSVSDRQCAQIAECFEASSAPWRVLVQHHPIMSPKEFPLDVTVFHSENLLQTIAEQMVDIVLAGHQHHAYIETREDDSQANGHQTLFVSASTAMSLRVRRQPQGFNMLTFTETSVRIDLLRYCDGRFSMFEALSHSK